MIWAFIANGAQVRITQHFPQGKVEADSLHKEAIWLIVNWIELGYEMPKPHEDFYWKDYVKDVRDLASLQADDAIFFTDPNLPGYSVAIVVLNDMNDPKQIYILSPVFDSQALMFIMQPIDRDQVIGAGRPLAKAK